MGCEEKLQWDTGYLEKKYGQRVFGVSLHGEQPLNGLAENESVLVYSAACRSRNSSGIHLVNGSEYELQIVEYERWKDKGLAATPIDGVAAPTCIMKLFAPLKYAWEHNWLVLLGGVDGTKFSAIGSGMRLRPDQSGEFISLANDAKLFYGNNTGEVIVKITRTK